MEIGDWIKEWAIPLSAGITLLLAIAAFGAIWQNYSIQKSERKRRMLGEIRDWVFEIRNITLEPITEENMAFMQTNIALKYGRAFNSVEYFEKSVVKIFKDEDFKTKVNKVAEFLIAVMVLGNVVYSKMKLNDQDFKAFVGYKVFRDSFLSEYENMLAELRKKNKDGIESRLIDLANQSLQGKYVIELNDSESALLSKITDIESGLL